MKEKNPMQLAASCVLFVTFRDGNMRTFYSRDIDHHRDNLHFWFSHLQNLVRNKPDWQGKVQKYAIYRCLNGEPNGEPIVREEMGHVNFTV